MDALRKTGLVLVGFNRSSISEPDPNKILYCGGVERVPQDALHEDGLNAVVARIAERIETVAFSGGMRADNRGPADRVLPDVGGSRRRARAPALVGADQGGGGLSRWRRTARARPRCPIWSRRSSASTRPRTLPLDTQGAARAAIEHAVACGRLLAKAKADVGHGEWLPWIEAHLSLKPRQVQRYMRIAEHDGELAEMRLTETHLSTRRMLELLASPRWPEHDEPDQDEESAPKPPAPVTKISKGAALAYARSHTPEPRDEAGAALAAMDRAMKGPEWGKRARERRLESGGIMTMSWDAARDAVMTPAPPVDLPQPEMIPVAWLRTGPARDVARALLAKLGEDRVAELAAVMGYVPGVPS
jgi:Protein of unknown function (DUF3102)